ncbi:MAG: ANTAR domain-containing protein [Clostridia bacterium]|jgi:response regulator NasT|nr:ANTAR domain-containing protein [Clostridia bacterium]MCI1999034.1 ANTAR domain-containing protein [Clostridia bacterium]MCI2013784.1 ANTAR domain-containing protein [Clostridia bacterium]
MENIIIGFTDRAKAEIIRDIVAKGGFYNTIVCTSGDEILRTANEIGDGVIICGYKVSDMIHTEIFELMPESFGMLVLLSRRQADLVDNQEIFSLVLPVTKNDVIKTVKMILSFNQESGKKSADEKGEKLLRSESDRIIIERAKLYLMNKYKITEDAAHRFMQKQSMNHGMKMVDTAKNLLNY